MPTQEVLLHDVWLAIIDAKAPYLSPIFNQLINDGGLVTVCSTFDACADALIKGHHMTPTVKTIDIALTGLTLPEKLEVLRFGKRYTRARYTDSEERDILDAFLTQNRLVRNYDRGMYRVTEHANGYHKALTYDVSRGLPFWLEQDLSWVSKQIWDARIKPARLSHQSLFSIMPSGVTAEGLRNQFEKFLFYEGTRDDTSPYRYPVELTGKPANYSVLKMVPKNYKTPRIICEEPLLHQLGQTPFAELFLRQLNSTKRSVFHPRGRVTLDDQQRNRDLALRASRDRSLATIDLSRASDSINYSVLRAVIPPTLVNDVLDTLTRQVLLPNGRTQDLYIACTMGARLTVPLQSYLYWCIICVAAHYCVTFGVGDYSMLDYCSAYNDDIIVPCVWYDTVVDLLTLCGFTVNEDKSFTGDIPYRESCGIEGYNGEDISSIYWPRRDLRMTNGDVPSLVKLSNRLFDRGYISARNIVVTALDNLCPGLPRIPVGSDDFGIWDYSMTVKYSPAKAARIVEIFSAPTKYKDARSLLRIFDVFDVEPPFYTETEAVMRQTYDNRKLSKPELFSGNTRQNLPWLLERFEYERWLALGSSYYDDVCKLLHVTEPSRVAKRLIPSGYTCTKRSYIVYDYVLDVKSQDHNDRQR